MDLIEFLEEEFRKVLMAYGKDREDLSDGDVETIQKNVKRECMRNMSDQEVRLLYRSFYKEYWKTHAMPPRSRSAS